MFQRFLQNYLSVNNQFYQFCVIGEATPDKKFKGEKTTLSIGNNNIIREGVTIHRGTVQDKSTTSIGDGNLLMAYSHVAHDCIVGNNNVFANHAGIAGHVTVGNNITIGALTTIHQFCKIGDYSFVGMNTSITMDIPAYIKVAADPARVIGLNTVGMTRDGISEESITLIKKAYKLLYKKGYKLDDAIKKIEKLEKSIRLELKVFIDSSLFQVIVYVLLELLTTTSPPLPPLVKLNAFLAKPGKLSQLVSKLINNEEKLYSISKSAYDYATQRRTWENTIDETIDLYKNVI